MSFLLAALILGGAFGTATAEVVSMDGSVMVVDIEVEVLETGESVVAHLAFQEDDVATLPLLDRGDGVFGIQTELEPKNYVVVFEIVGDDGASSGPVTLTQLGAELGPESSGPTTTVDESALSDDSRQLLWLAVALGAASLSLLAFWVLGDRERDQDTGGDPADAETGE